MRKLSQKNVEKLIEDFSSKKLPKIEWTHEAHLIVALWHNSNYHFSKALNLVRLKIKAYNLAVGTPNTDSSGYHETLTIFWMLTTKCYLLANVQLSLEEQMIQFLESDFSSKHYPLAFYSREVLFSKEARKNWIDGDIQQLQDKINEIDMITR